MHKSFILIFSLLIGLQAHAAKIIRGPYLQKLTSESIVVRFRTDVPTKVFVQYGAEANQVNLRQDNYLFTAEHIVTLSKLKSNTKYFYEIFEETTKGYKKLSNEKDTEYSFITAPEANEQNGLNIWVLGDPGIQSEPEFSKDRRKDQILVRDSFFTYLKKNQIKKPGLILTLGDNAYSFGTDEEFQKGFFEMYTGILPNTPLYTTFGNHDAGIRKDFIAFSARSYPKPRGTYYDIFSLPDKKAYYSFDYGPVHFIVLDSFDSIWEEPLAGIEGRERVWTKYSKESNLMLSWFENDLNLNKSLWTIVAFHHPPYIDEEKKSGKKELWQAWTNAYLVPLVEKYKVDLVLCGHVHNYQRSYPILSKLSKEGETEITNKESSEMDEPIKYGFFYNKENTLGPLKLPKYEASVESTSVKRYMKGTGTIYTILGSSGSAFKGVPKKKNSIFYVSTKKAGSILLTIDQKRLEVKFITNRAEVLDEFSIQK